MATIDQLAQELVSRASYLPEFRDSSFYVVDLNDLKECTALETQPVLGVLYLGGAPAPTKEMRSGGAEVRPTSASVPGIVMAELAFTIVIGIQYAYAGGDDTKPKATNLMDALRPHLLGFTGVNTRPWSWAGERPLPEASGDGMAFYEQTWHTVVPVVSTADNS